MHPKINKYLKVVQKQAVINQAKTNNIWFILRKYRETW